ncbi:hypothetical protein EQV77_15785 [Halobacillus fulvus]|nr:hypothetical protein EQV77_15785 [Halobacillus fulvus]
MKRQNIDRYKFDFVFHKVKFDVLYFLDETPNKLAFGIKEHNYYFELPVKRGFNIVPFLDRYSEFCRIMGLKYNLKAPFKPRIFFDALNGQIPKSASQKNIPAPHQIAIYRNDVEEADKIYFVNWRDNKKAGHQVSSSNLEKTRKLLSKDAYLMCKSKNISSCWSPHPADAKSFKGLPR